MAINKNLFGVVLTYPAPSSNYRGENEDNRAVLQKLNKNGKDFTFISSDASRNTLRELLAQAGLPCNRRRLDNAGQPAVEFQSFPDASKYADDCLFGYMVVDQEAVKKNPTRPPKRDSILKMNLAVATAHYRHDTVFHQSPFNAGKSPWQNSSKSALLHREVSFTSFQYPFALSAHDCQQVKPAWLTTLLKSIGQLTQVGGGHARHYYEMAPASLIVRLTPQLVAGFNTYGFDSNGNFPELARINQSDLSGKEFWLGGEIVRNMEAEEKARLKKEAVNLHDNPQKLLEALGKHWLSGKG